MHPSSKFSLNIIMLYPQLDTTQQTGTHIPVSHSNKWREGLATISGLENYLANCLERNNSQRLAWI